MTKAMHFDSDVLNKHFGRIWPVHVDAFSQLLITLRKCFGGDLDLMLVLAIIGSRTLPASRINGLSYSDFESGQRHDIPFRPINLQSIADCTGIPRETVRRKVSELQALGWIERRENGVLAVTEQASEALVPATQATMLYLVAVGAACVDTANREVAAGG